ncbi:MAG: NAD(P)-dependent oxidoreductase [Armatimonadetes bacterium]|nr:NAD(P)-dependent oxidoreductase [Armatimonadota bacterium]
MRVLLIGGSGMVGSLILPAFCDAYAAGDPAGVRVLDLRPPASVAPEACEYHAGSVTDTDVLQKAIAGFGAGDVLIYLAMGSSTGWGTPENIATHYDAGVKGLHLALQAASGAGIRHVVYTGSLSAYNLEGVNGKRYFGDEGLATDASDFYGLTKRFGESICEAFCRRVPGFSVNALRLCHPRPLVEWEERIRREPDGFFAGVATAAPDVADAYLRAARTPLGGFQAFHISGDAVDKHVSLRKAGAMLGWKPRHVRADVTGEAK